MNNCFYVYILANVRSQRPPIYTGVTRDMNRRMAEHRLHPSGFVARYHCDTLVFVETTAELRAAVAREKQIKGWTRAKKIALIERANPAFCDLFPGYAPPDS